MMKIDDDVDSDGDDKEEEEDDEFRQRIRRISSLNIKDQNNYYDDDIEYM